MEGKTDFQGIQSVDKHPLISNNQTISHQPNIFILDFKSIYPQFSPDNQPIVVINHKIILIEPFVIKEFLEILKSNIEMYEKKFGKIEKPKQIKKAEELFKKQDVTSTKSFSTDYTG